jgi:PEP-CTERM motif
LGVLAMRAWRHAQHFSTLGAVGSFVYQGTTYEVTDSGSFTINSGQVSVPTISTGPGGTSFATVFTPFTLSGTLTGVSSGGLTTSLELSGGGTASLIFSQVAGGSPQFFSASYGFESAAAVPEPSTLLLVGAAAAGVVARRRRRAKQDDE